jgi:hypothetical protein
MSGTFSVPFAAASLFVESRWAKIVWLAMAYMALVLTCFLLWARNRRLADRLAPKIGLYLKHDPFGLTTGIEIGKGENGEDFPYVQVCVEPLTQAPIYDPVPNITRIEHRPKEFLGFSEVFGESRRIDWSWQRGSVTLHKGKPVRLNIVRYDNATPAPSDITDNPPYKLSQFYSSLGKTGEYRYTIHVEGREVVPAQAYVYVRWRVHGHPEVRLEPLAGTVVVEDPQRSTVIR